VQKVAMIDMNGTEVGQLEIAGSIVQNDVLLTEAVLSQRASLRRGTHAVKNRSAVRGGGKKPWRQKGTGKARHGTIRSPLWVGGGVAFGPVPRSYGYKLPKKKRKLALKVALLNRIDSGKLLVLKNLELKEPKTQVLVKLLTALGPSKRTLIVVEEVTRELSLAARNLKQVKVLKSAGLNVLDLLSAERVICEENVALALKGELANDGSA
jgi:large subunit ribosomal protein L4